MPCSCIDIICEIDCTAALIAECLFRKISLVLQNLLPCLKIYRHVLKTQSAIIWQKIVWNAKSSRFGRYLMFEKNIAQSWSQITSHTLTNYDYITLFILPIHIHLKLHIVSLRVVIKKNIFQSLLLQSKKVY